MLFVIFVSVLSPHQLVYYVWLLPTLSTGKCELMTFCFCMCLLYLCFYIPKMKDNALLLLPKTSSKTFHLPQIMMHPLSISMLFLECFWGLACDQNDLDSNDSGYANTSILQSFQLVQLQLEVCPQNSSNNWSVFNQCVWFFNRSLG